MRANDVRSKAPVRHGAYLCLRVPAEVRDAALVAAMPALVARLRLRNEFDADGGDPPDAVAFLKRERATPGDLADEGLLYADSIVHVASADAATVTTFCAEAMRLLSPAIASRVIEGVVRPATYTGDAMHDFAYAHRVLQGPGAAMPNAFLIPTSKTAAWWEKDWMERHTYFLPRYDVDGRRTSEGHALAATAGIASLLRRTYKSRAHPAPEGTYDFVNYFECADADLATFHDVCGALRDVKRNPEWSFVREGPTWHGRRVSSWAALFTG